MARAGAGAVVALKRSLRVNRILDVVVSGLGLVVFSRVLLVVMAALWLQDRGSPFYIAPRMARAAACSGW